MKDIKCPKCGRMYPEDAMTCPGCKHPNYLIKEEEITPVQEKTVFVEETKCDEDKKRKKRIKGVINIILGVWLLVLGIMCLIAVGDVFRNIICVLVGILFTLSGIVGLVKNKKGSSPC